MKYELQSIVLHTFFLFWSLVLYFSLLQHALTLSDPMSDLVRHYDFPVPDAFLHVVRILANSQRRLYSFCLCFSLLKL
jgi:hypothetical protein